MLWTEKDDLKDEKDERKSVSSAKENMLEDVEESRSFMKRMNRTGEITEP